ncbi:MAG: hypothetical protein CXT77_02015 [uncultured DHVE6 group euryarchaeote]|nr:MAG: hypothetical protein CXT77_02015 [uncultured DHVE6 group euryarchaeote]
MKKYPRKSYRRNPTKGDKKILKRLATFEFKLKEAKVEVQGTELVGRPWERIKK